MDRAWAQMKSDGTDCWNHLVKSGTFAGLAFIGLFVLAGELAKLAHVWLAKNRQPRPQNVIKILHDPERRAREAGL